MATGITWFIVTDYLPLYYPTSLPGRIRARLVWLWEGVGGVGGWDLGEAPGGWGEGHLFGISGIHGDNLDLKKGI
jgi:dolichyldiphosphatase